MTTPYPSLFVGALITESATGAIVGSATIDTNLQPEPIDAAAVKEMARRITERAHADGDLPTGQRYVVISWQRYAAVAK